MDITGFLLARLDEDEAFARASLAVDPTPWTSDAKDEGSTSERAGAGAGLVIAADRGGLWDCEGSDLLCMTAPTARHVARHDPSRVLRDVDAKRQIVYAFGVVDRVATTAKLIHDPLLQDPYAESRTRNVRSFAMDVLVQLAAVYADHADYDARWRPVEQR